MRFESVCGHGLYIRKAADKTLREAAAGHACGRLAVGACGGDRANAGAAVERRAEKPSPSNGPFHSEKVLLAQFGEGRRTAALRLT